MAATLQVSDLWTKNQQPTLPGQAGWLAASVNILKSTPFKITAS